MPAEEHEIDGPEMQRALDELLGGLDQLQPRLCSGTQVGRSQYYVVEHLGEGSFGDVYAVRHGLQDWPRAVKVLKHKWRSNPLVCAAFKREAAAMERIRHERFVTVFDYHEPEHSPPFFVMELLYGEDLRRRTERGPLTPRQIQRLARQVLEGLEALHARGLLHRDIKPSNVFVCEGDELNIKILDLGLALPRDRGSTSPAGTPRYCAPEQTEGNASRRSDLYSVARVLYEVVHHVPSADAIPAVPTELDALLRRTMDHDVDQRPRSARELREQLDEAFDPWVRAAEDSEPRAARARSPAGRRSLLAIVLVIGLVGLVALAYLGMAPACPGPPRPNAACISAGPVVHEAPDVEALVKRCIDASPDAALAEPRCRRRIERERLRPGRDEVARAFWLDRHEVTWAQVARWLDRRGVTRDEGVVLDRATRRPLLLDGSPLSWDGEHARVAADHADRPAAGVTWFGARAYCRDHGGRLPTELEWERAAHRAPSDALTRCEELVVGRASAYWHPECPGPSAPVDATRPHGRDVTHDVLHLWGNVAEWVDATIEEEGRVFALAKGGSVTQPLLFARPGARMRLGRTQGEPDVGFRCAADAVSDG